MRGSEFRSLQNGSLSEAGLQKRCEQSTPHKGGYSNGADQFQILIELPRCAVAPCGGFANFLHPLIESYQDY